MSSGRVPTRSFHSLAGVASSRRRARHSAKSSANAPAAMREHTIVPAAAAAIIAAPGLHAEYGDELLLTGGESALLTRTVNTAGVLCSTVRWFRCPSRWGTAGAKLSARWMLMMLLFMGSSTKYVRAHDLHVHVPHVPAPHVHSPHAHLPLLPKADAPLPRSSPPWLLASLPAHSPLPRDGESEAGDHQRWHLPLDPQLPIPERRLRTHTRERSL